MQLENPIKNVPQEEKCRLNTDILTCSRDFFRVLHPNLGVLSSTINHLLLKLEYACKTHGINGYPERDQFIAFLNKCVIDLPDERTASSGTVNKESDGNDGRGTERIRPTDTTNAGKSRRLSSQRRRKKDSDNISQD